MPTLIVYATKHGTTEKCAAELKNKLPDATLCNLKSGMPDLAGYDAVILGASIYAGMPRKKMKAFAAKHAELLKKKKLGLFLCCMADGEQAQKQLEAAYSPELIKSAAVHGVLGGGFQISTMNFFEKFVVEKVSGKKAEESFTVHQNVLDDFLKTFA